MPTYELAFIVRKMSRPEVVSTLKRTSEAIWKKGGFIRKLDNLGSRALPHKISEHGLVHREGQYFNIQFDAPPANIKDLSDEFGLDIDIIRKNFFKMEEPPKFECTLQEEMLPPAYRKEVKDMIKIAQKKQKKKYQYNSGFDYYPFQK
ncbi:hypothetical protein ACFFRR_010575 [Megaselia abdita]